MHISTRRRIRHVSRTLPLIPLAVLVAMAGVISVFGIGWWLP
ncbi:MAG TPA: hypothetical protein VN702_17790 [Acetobacteraceae bacterium]|nr:hypothetical protein [Acetobacteraceae bacterium]